MKTTIAEYSGEGPVFSYDPVDISLIPPRKRDYSKGKKETVARKPLGVLSCKIGID